MMLSLNGGIIAGVATSLLKGMTISFENDGLKGFTPVYLVIALCLVSSQLKSLNIAMEIYE